MLKNKDKKRRGDDNLLFALGCAVMMLIGAALVLTIPAAIISAAAFVMNQGTSNEGYENVLGVYLTVMGAALGLLTIGFLAVASETA